MDIDRVRELAARAISPLKPADARSAASKNFLFDAKRTDAGRALPAYYLVYFLLVDLLGFRNLGQFEKVAWSVPVDYEGRAFLIEHRKFGLGIFAADLPADEIPAREIAQLIWAGVKLAEPYFDWRAEQAAQQSQLNVRNKASDLFERFTFFADLYEIKRAEAERRKDEKIRTEFEHGYSMTLPVYELRREAKWLALATIESFFSWTEHVFILIAILQGKCTTGADVARLAESNWEAKYKAALDLADPKAKSLYDELLVIRRQLRNFVAHGSFGKQGEAFQFHSGAGAVPMMMPHRRDGTSFRFGQGTDFVEHEAVSLLHDFIDFLWSGSRAPAFTYIQEYQLPLILTMAQSGEYTQAMASGAAMKAHADHLVAMMDRSANMDF